MTEVLDRPATANGAGGTLVRQQSALAAMAHRYQVSQEGLAEVIRKTCIKGNCTDAEFRAFVLVANQYGLNPMTKEIHAFASGGSVVPIVGVDGWTRLVNQQKDFDGCEFEEVHQDGDTGITCTMHVKGRSHPIRITEWLSECKRNTPPWNTMKRRMLRHRAFIQAARLAFSLAGIYDEDEARDIVTNETAPQQSTGAAALNASLKVTSRPVSEGQRLEVDPEAMRHAESEPVVIEGEEVASDADAVCEPPAETATANAPAEPSPKEQFWMNVRDMAESAGFDWKADEKFVRSGVKVWALKAGVVNKEHEAPADAITRLFEQIAAKAGPFSPGK